MDHYAALGVSPNAGNAELNNAFKHKSNLLIPPRNNNITRRHTALRNAAKTREVLKESYNLLKNKGRRNEYNRTRKVQDLDAIDYIYVIDNLTKSGYSYPELDPTGIRDFQIKVNDKLREGYKLHGNPIVTKGVIKKRWTTVTYPITTSEIMYSNNMIYQVMIKGISGEQFTSYKLLPIRVDKDEQTLAPEEMKEKDVFIKDINKHLNEGWKLYNVPVELEINRNVENRYAPWGYIYQAIVR